jgi:hypothetical protein
MTSQSQKVYGQRHLPQTSVTMAVQLSWDVYKSYMQIPQGTRVQVSLPPLRQLAAPACAPSPAPGGKVARSLQR